MQEGPTQTQTSSRAPLELVYWKVRGIAQPLRHLMEYLELEYVDNTVQCPIKYFSGEAEEIKLKCLSSNLPVLKDNSFMVSQAIVIAKYLCKKAGRIDLLGKTVVDQCRIDELFSKFTPHRSRMCDRINAHMQGQYVDRKQLMNDAEELFRQDYIKSLRRALQKTEGNWFLGYLSIADFFIYETAFYMEGIFKETYEKMPELQLLKANFEALPAIKAYQASDRERLELFLTELGSIWTGNPKYK